MMKYFLPCRPSKRCHSVETSQSVHKHCCIASVLTGPPFVSGNPPKLLCAQLCHIPPWCYRFKRNPVVRQEVLPYLAVRFHVSSALRPAKLRSHILRHWYPLSLPGILKPHLKRDIRIYITINEIHCLVEFHRVYHGKLFPLGIPHRYSGVNSCINANVYHNYNGRSSSSFKFPSSSKSGLFGFSDFSGNTWTSAVAGFAFGIPDGVWTSRSPRSPRSTTS